MYDLGMYFMGYEGMKALMSRFSMRIADGLPQDSLSESKHTAKKTSPFVFMMAGGLSGTLSWIVLYPLDLVRTRFLPFKFNSSVFIILSITYNHLHQVKSVMQKEALSDKPKYKSALEFVGARWKKAGVRGFYYGIGAQLTRSFPVHAINFLVYESVLDWCKRNAV
jgi:solute carrier family 25 (mitochondrial carnitine/acylcarnitine transporter), member 20/29